MPSGSSNRLALHVETSMTLSVLERASGPPEAASKALRWERVDEVESLAVSQRDPEPSDPHSPIWDDPGSKIVRRLEPQKRLEHDRQSVTDNPPSRATKSGLTRMSAPSPSAGSQGADRSIS